MWISPTLLSSLLLLLSTATANAIPRDSQPAIENDDDEFETFKNKHCKLISSVTYHQSWMELFIENEYKCDLPPLHLRSQQHDASHLLQPRPHNRKQKLPPTSPPQQQHKDDRDIYLDLDKHQIISYGCAQIPDPKALPIGKIPTLRFTIPLLTNQSCIPPGHLVEYKEFPRSYTARWALTNYNRGEETICDWYYELAQVAAALDTYCEYAIERGDVDGQRGEVLAYGRDREREERVEHSCGV